MVVEKLLIFICQIDLDLEYKDMVEKRADQYYLFS